MLVGMGGGLLFSWGEQLRHVFQEVLIVSENHVVQGMVVTQEDAGVVFRILEGDAVTEERHLMVAGIVVEPEVVETVAGGLSLVGGVAYVEHDSRFLIEELFEDDSHRVENLRVVGAVLVLAVVDEEMIGTLVHQVRVFVKTDVVAYLLIGHEAERQIVNLRQLVGRAMVEIVGRECHLAVAAECSRICSRHLSRASIIC